MNGKKESELLFEYKNKLEWTSITTLRPSIVTALKNINSKRTIDIAVTVCSELMENVFKHTTEKLAYVSIVNDTTEKFLTLKVENSTVKTPSKNLELLKNELTRVNSYEDINKLYLDSIMRSASLGKNESKIGFSLIRKMTNGSPILISDSQRFNPGIKLEIKIPIL